MSELQAIILGLVQALTEFLPVSSSGHLALAEHLAGASLSDASAQLAFNVMLHAATLLATLIFFREDIISIVLDFFSKEQVARGRAQKLVLAIIIGSIPAAVVGLSFKAFIEASFSSLFIVGVGLLYTSAILEVSRRKITSSGQVTEKLQAPSLGVALIIGIFQAISILPGVSRSGSTICSGLIFGMRPEQAFKFSFLLSIPAIFGATLVELKDISNMAQTGFLPLVLGFLTALIVGYYSLVILGRFVKEKKFLPFSIYTGILGIIVILTSI